MNEFVKCLNLSFPVLIPKNSGANNIRDFRSINLVGYIYKLIAEVLARRMTLVLGKVIGECQHVFVSGRQILDAALVS